MSRKRFLGVPWLRPGTGNSPAEGGCILQVIDWIDRGSWTDTPTCVLPYIGTVAIQANDSLDDDERQELLDLAPRIMGTALRGKKKQVTAKMARRNTRIDKRLQDFVLPDDEGTDLDYLKALLDEYDRITHRKKTTTETIDFMPLYTYLKEIDEELVR